MRVFHGSTISPDKLNGGKIQPQKAVTYEGSGVPEAELQNAIYTTPELSYALAMASRPENSRTEIDKDNHKITFDNPEGFDPEKDIYIYEFETDVLPEARVKRLKNDQDQITLFVNEGLEHVNVHKMKAKEVMNYYELTNYKEEGENLEPPKDWHSGIRR